ncbi:MAG: AAA family ATPase, partial [Bacteroidales bacterium]|nr:AAA family ATPase [Bacteroidales bacterium]
MKDSTPIYEIAHEFSENTSRAVFLTGKAGTGKTTFLRNLRDHTRKQIAVVAPTGVAAINAGGVTIHSFFQLPFTPFAPTEEGRKNLLKQIKMTNLRRKIMRQLEILVIDEISMVRADILDEIDTVLRAVRYNHDEPFGGVQVIYIGDLYQLPPVTIPEEWAVIAPFYPSPFFFDSQVARQQPPIYIEL